MLHFIYILILFSVRNMNSDFKKFYFDVIVVYNVFHLVNEDFQVNGHNAIF
jgi:hypothetical protein